MPGPLRKGNPQPHKGKGNTVKLGYSGHAWDTKICPLYPGFHYIRVSIFVIGRILLEKIRLATSFCSLFTVLYEF